MSHCLGCKRPIAGAVDLERWRREVNGGRMFWVGAAHEHPPEPAWARALCWSAHNCEPRVWLDIHDEDPAWMRPDERLDAGV